MFETAVTLAMIKESVKEKKNNKKRINPPRPLEDQDTSASQCISGIKKKILVLPDFD